VILRQRLFEARQAMVDMLFAEHASDIALADRIPAIRQLAIERIPADVGDWRHRAIGRRGRLVR
jgi:hypothetical protein